MKYAKNIKKLREKLNLTRKEFAKKLKLTYASISNYENGKYNPGEAIVERIIKLAAKKNIAVKMKDLREVK